MSSIFSHQALLQEIRSAYEDAANPSAAIPMMAYMKDVASFFGIPATPRRLIQKELFAAHKSIDFAQLCPLLQQLFFQPERELQYLAQDWLYHQRKSFTPVTIVLIEAMLTNKSWWDTVDFLAAHCLGHWAKTFPASSKPIIEGYIHSPNFWLNRSAILHQLFYKDQTNPQLLSDCIVPHLHSKEFFIKKAIGWALRQYARTNPEWVIQFVEEQPLSALSRREALKHL